MFKRFMNVVKPSINYAVFATTATLIIPFVIQDKKSLQHLLNTSFQNLITQAQCEADEIASTPSLIEQADAAAENAKSTVKTPVQFENIKNIIQQSTVNSYDGFRFQVQKQVNLNTVVSHFFWFGSASVPPIYQYRIIIPIDDNKMLINVATDPDFNLEGEVKGTINSNATAKASFLLGDQSQTIDVNLDLVDDCSSTQLQLVQGSTGGKVGVSYVQALTPTLCIGAQGQYLLDKSVFEPSYGGIFDDGDNQVAAVLDKDFRIKYMRRVNPNRVHVSSDLVVDKTANSTMSLAAEYTYKQGKLHFSVDSNLTIKSSLDTNISPGFNLQMCAEASELNSQFKLGSGLQIG